MGTLEVGPAAGSRVIGVYRRSTPFRVLPVSTSIFLNDSLSSISIILHP